MEYKIAGNDYLASVEILGYFWLLFCFAFFAYLIVCGEFHAYNPKPQTPNPKPLRQQNTIKI